MGSDALLPDLQASILCEDVRQEVNGLQTLVGVISVLPTPSLPVGLLKLCLLDSLVRRFWEFPADFADPGSGGGASDSRITYRI
jgi:hypothetical protein